ncbi:MAG: hypothetical protein WCO24_02355 [Actinomycetes bacterium]
MRFLITSLIYLAALLSLLLGVAERTIWHPDSTHQLSIELNNSTPYVILPASTLGHFAGNLTVSAGGSKQVFASVGRESDVAAWVGSCQRTEIEIAPGGKKLVESTLAGGGVLSDPEGSDLWRDQRVSAQTLDFPVDTANQAAVLVASNGIERAPSKITLNWQIPFDLTPSNFALILGGILLIAGFIMNWLTYWHIRNTRGPRRRTPKPPTGPQIRKLNIDRITIARGRRVAGRSKLAFPVGILVLGLLSGCTSAVTKPADIPTATLDANAVPVSLLQGQLERILTDVALSAANGDKGKDAKQLQNRFNGPALEIRAARYILQQRNKKVPAPESIAAGPISFSLPAATSQWPRTAMVVTQRTGSSELPQMLVMQQDSPRSNYKVWYSIAMLPGAKIPAVPSADVGSAPVTPNSLFLAMSPKALARTYGDVIDNGLTSTSAGMFDVSKDEFYSQLSQSQKAQKAALKKASLKFTHNLGENNVLSLSTSDAGALVAVYMTDSYVIKPTKLGSAVTVSGNEKTMLGSNGSIRGVKSVYGDMLLFYVPALASKDQIRLLGVTQGLVSVRGL